MRYIAEDLAPRASANVSTLTTLVDWHDYGARYHMLLFYLINNDVSNDCFLVIQTSEDGVHPDVNSPTVTVAPQSQGSLEVGHQQIRKYWRLLAKTNSLTYPTVNVSYGVRGCDRLV